MILYSAAGRARGRYSVLFDWVGWTLFPPRGCSTWRPWSTDGRKRRTWTTDDAANGGEPCAAARPLSLDELVELLSRGLALPPPYAALHQRAERLLEAAGSTLPPLDAGVEAAERTRRDWQRHECYRAPL